MRRVGDRRWSRWTLTLLLPITIATGCGEEAPKRATPPKPSEPTAQAAPPQEPPASPKLSHAELVAQGERVYKVNCIACHNGDPNQKGGIGPAVAGASAELLEARVIRGTYPPGYKPKRDTQMMIPLPHLEPDIPALAAYLAAVAQPQ